MTLHHPVKDLILEKAPQGDVTQWFAENPALYARFGILYHNGVDIVRPHGTPMYAVERATVVQVNDDPSGFGKHVRIISKNPDEHGVHREWTYGHCDKIHFMVNDEVFAGQHIADMGNTGFVVSSVPAFWRVNPYAGTHLHLGMRELRFVDTGGWRYKGSKLKRMEILNYENGVRGAVDPVPLLRKAVTAENARMYEQLRDAQTIVRKLLDRFGVI